MVAQTRQKMKKNLQQPTGSCPAMEQLEAFDVKLCLPFDLIIVS